jgi:NAD(P)-dependent dehydrogenase (short-subunit alcohol dehydrogenase family)
MKHRFADCSFVVTGGCAGIGRATVDRLVSDGARVFIVDVDEATGASVANGSAGAVRFVQTDLTDPSAIESMGATIADQCEALHGLVNNCGIYRESSIAETGDADWETQVSINLRAPALCARALLPLLKRGPGHIVNLSSEGAYKAYQNRWVYDATKAGVVALARNMAVEFNRFGIRANSVAPGWVVTEMHFAGHRDPEVRKRELETMEYDGAILGRLARPQEIASAIAFLLSDDASYITATTLHVDGGRVAH